MYKRIVPKKRAYSTKKRFKSKKPIRGFRDLEVYQKAQELAIEIVKTIQPFLAEKRYTRETIFCESALSIPILIANAHTQRFDNPPEAMKTLKRVINGCNNMIVYIEQIKEIYTLKPENSEEELSEEIAEKNRIYLLCDEMMKSYNSERIKLLRLLKAWKKFYEKDTENARLINENQKREN